MVYRSEMWCGVVECDASQAKPEHAPTVLPCKQHEKGQRCSRKWVVYDVYIYLTQLIQDTPTRRQHNKQLLIVYCRQRLNTTLPIVRLRLIVANRPCFIIKASGKNFLVWVYRSLFPTWYMIAIPIHATTLVVGRSEQNFVFNSNILELGNCGLVINSKRNNFWFACLTNQFLMS